MSDATNFHFKMTSANPAFPPIDTAQISVKSFPRIMFKDSIFDFFPHGEVTLNDTTGTIIENYFFVEGLNFDVLLENTDNALKFPTADEILMGKTTIGKLEGSYTWGIDQINNTVIENHIAGHNFFYLESKYKDVDIATSKAWNYETAGVLNPAGAKPISEVAREIAVNTFAISNPLLQFITPTMGMDYWLQPNIPSAEFLKNILEKNAFTYATPKSPFFTFINMKGEFYFMSLQLMMLQKPVAFYTLDRDITVPYEDFKIKNFVIQFGGSKVNRDSYTRRSYILDMTTGQIVKQGLKDYNIHEYQLAPEGVNKFTIQNETSNRCFTIENQGLSLLPNQVETHLARQNANMQDSDLSYRVIILVRFNPYCVSGKVVQLNFSKTSKLGLTALEFTGNWLIVESSVVCGQDGIAMSQLTLSKPGIILDPTNPFLATYFGVGL